MSIEKEEQIKEIETLMNQLFIERSEILQKLKATGIKGCYQEAKRLNEIAQMLEGLNNQILLLEGPICWNQEIDIYLNKLESDDKIEYYHIMRHQSLEKIGYVRVTLKSFEPALGQIGYGIDEEYRGNHYTLQALELLRTIIISHGLNRIVLTSFPNNQASIKIIERLGGTLKKEADQEHQYNTYEVNFEEIEKPARR